MRLLFARLWQSASIKRVVTVGLCIMVITFFLFCFLASLGDTDLPPTILPSRGSDLVGSLLEWAHGLLFLSLAVWVTTRLLFCGFRCC